MLAYFLYFGLIFHNMEVMRAVLLGLLDSKALDVGASLVGEIPG